MGTIFLGGRRPSPVLKRPSAGCFLIVGTSGIITYGDKHFIRIPITSGELAERIKDQEDEVALVFGREDIGLTQEQLARCDILVNIPSNEEYPILNLSHAATIVMYDIFASHGKPSNPKKATEFEKDKTVPVLRFAIGRHRLSGPPQGEDQHHVPPDDGAGDTDQLGVPHHHGRHR